MAKPQHLRCFSTCCSVLPELSLNEATVKENEDKEVEEEAVRYRTMTLNFNLRFIAYLNCM